MSNNNSNTEENKPKRNENWEQIKQFEKDGIVVIVSKLPLPAPRYSIEIAHRTQFGEKKIGRHFQVHIDRKKGSITVSKLPVRSIVTLIAEAESFIEEQEQSDLEEFLKWKKEKSTEAKTDDNEVLVGGKR